jgi:Fic family protein
MPGRTVKLTWTPSPGAYAPRKYRRSCRYDAFIPDVLVDLDVRLPGDVAGVVSEAESQIQKLNEADERTLAPLARLLLRTESIASSKVEGMQMSLREMARAEARAETGGRASGAAVEVLGNIAAMELAVADASSARRFSLRQLTTIHRRLMERSPHPAIAGRVRKVQNWIGGNDYNPCGADFVPPPPDQVARLLDDLCDGVNDDVLPPIVQAALVHAQLETIHPFEDGNGRTGRALIHVVLKRRGIAPNYVPPMSVILANARDDYIRGLTRFRVDGVVEWIDQFASAAAESANLARAYLGALDALIGAWRSRLADSENPPRSDASAWALIEVLPGYPIISGPVAAAVLGRSRPQTYQAIAALEDAGVLLPLTQSKRNRSWEAAGLLDLLDGLEAGRLPG